MNDILSYLAGIITAFFIVAIPLRVWRGRFWVLIFACLLFPVSSDAAHASASYYLKNNGAPGSGTIGVSWKVNYDSGALVTGPFSDSLAPGFQTTLRTIGSHNTAVVHYSTTGHDWSTGLTGPGVSTRDISGQSNVGIDLVAITYTNHISSITFTNTNAFGADFTLNIYTNGVLWTNTVGYFPQGDSLSANFTNSTAFTWEVVGPGDQSTDYSPKVYNSGSSTASTGSNQYPTGGSSSQTSGNPIAYTPTQSTNTIPSDSSVANRQNAEAIVRTIQQQSNLDTERLLAQLEKNRTNSSGSSGYNYSNLLEQIIQNGSNLLSSNFFAGGAFVATNLVNVAIGTGTNEVEASVVGGMISNGIVGVQATLTNQVISAPSTNALAYSLTSPSGATLTFNANLLSTSGDNPLIASAKAQIVKFMQWLHAWILKLIPFVMFWAFTKQVLAWQTDLLNKGFVAMPKSLDLSPWKLAAKLPLGIVAAIVVGFVLGFVPTGVISYMQGISMSAGIPSLADHIQNSGVTGARWLGSMITFWGYLNEAIPFTTIIFSLAHFAAFQLYGVKLVHMVNVALGRLGFVLGSIALVFVPFSVDAAQVEVWNLSGTNVHASNVSSTAEIQFPAGGPFLLNLEAGEWVIRGTNSLEIPDNEERFVLRVDVAGMATAQAESEWSWYWAGVVHWVPIWGALAIAAVLRGFVSQSLTLRFSSSD